MVRTRKTWREKLEIPVAGLPKVCEVPDKWVKTMGGRRVLVPTPLMVDEYVRTVPRRKLVTVGQIRRHLAGPFQADSTCPLTSSPRPPRRTVRPARERSPPTGASSKTTAA
jgi:hypothetical protein